ncbi:hypothetical protein [Paenibacillus paeoniae]|uniref:Uncharacterized protein n=1 Tax=Paenibacillus paeoniae TaxID=2292705 RepID=A0A371NZV6_9BACL|nr:hypothetical protein [Paenibacillus paeoniae]REK69151.1 hypothetical protein DX130_25830 [Paenibacillus paeoniae]
MTTKYKLDDLLDIIRKRLEIQDDADCFHANIAGIQTAFEKKGAEELVITTDFMYMTLHPGQVNEHHNKLIEMVEFGHTEYKEPLNLDHPIEIAAFLSDDLDETKKSQSSPFNFVLKVWKHRYDIEDVADKFEMIFEETHLELESVSEDEIVIRANGAEVYAHSFESYADKLLEQDQGIIYEQIHLSITGKVAVIDSWHIPSERSAIAVSTVLNFLVTYYHSILIKANLMHSAEIIRSRNIRSDDVIIDGVSYEVYLGPSAMI